MITVKILADSTNGRGNRLTTFELKYPRFIHAEFMTHRAASRNAASSRAIPIKRTLAEVVKHPATPEFWGANQRGMQAYSQLTGIKRFICRRVWFLSRWVAVALAWVMNLCGLHKQIANRILEPWSHITVIATFGERGLGNFFGLRAHKAAQPEFQVLAYRMLYAWMESTPRKLFAGDWHIPFGDDLNLNDVNAIKIAVGRIARVSYETHGGGHDWGADIALHDRLAAAGHWSPFEHVARCQPDPEEKTPTSNLGPGWLQYRKMFINECAQLSGDDLAEIIRGTPKWFEI